MGGSIHIEGNAQRASTLGRCDEFRRLVFLNAVVGGSNCEAETRVEAMLRGGVMRRRVVGMRCDAREFCLRRISWLARARAHQRIVT